MDSEKVKLFMQLAGQKVSDGLTESDPQIRQLGAQLLLSEVLEYIIKGLGVTPVVNGVAIVDPENIKYQAERPVDLLEMLDGLSDVAYTMYWNSCAFGLPLEQAFDLVSDNNLEKFVRLEKSAYKAGMLDNEEWHCGQNISWPQEVATVEVININGMLYAVGKDNRGKVRKPSSYRSVDLKGLI